MVETETTSDLHENGEAEQGLYIIDSTRPEVEVVQDFYHPIEAGNVARSYSSYFFFLFVTGIPEALVAFSATYFAPLPVKKYGSWTSHVVQLTISCVLATLFLRSDRMFGFRGSDAG